MAERFNIAGSTITWIGVANQMVAFTLASLLYHQWWMAAWFGIPSVGVSAYAVYLLLPARTPFAVEGGAP